ncbi:MAG: glycosyltransferase family 4 protein [Candidatus Zixiibacteriota bacterium]
MNILTVANIVARKRIDLCAMICLELERKYGLKAIKWTVIGRGPLENEIKAMAPSSMEFIPKVQSLKEYFRSADIFVLPSSDEGFGMVYIEAIMCGCPVICRKYDGGQEIVDTTGGGIAVEILKGELESVVNILEAIDKILSNRNVYANNSTKAAAMQMVDPDKIKKQWAAVLADIIKSAKS